MVKIQSYQKTIQALRIQMDILLTLSAKKEKKGSVDEKDNKVFFPVM